MSISVSLGKLSFLDVLLHRHRSDEHPGFGELKRLCLEAGRLPTLGELEGALGNEFYLWQKAEALCSLRNSDGATFQSSDPLCRFEYFEVPLWDPFYPREMVALPWRPWAFYWVASSTGLTPERWQNRGFSVSLVGSRRPAAYAGLVIDHMLRGAPHNVVVVSGLAHGVDSLGHNAALREGVATLGVLAEGPLRRVQQDLLALRILQKGGALVSEFPWYTEPLPWFFPWRNRLIAGLGDLVWIVQATKKSGSRHTAHFAEQYGRPLAATPGSIFSELSSLPHELLRIPHTVMLEHPQDLHLWAERGRML